MADGSLCGLCLALLLFPSPSSKCPDNPPSARPHCQTRHVFICRSPAAGMVIKGKEGRSSGGPGGSQMPASLTPGSAPPLPPPQPGPLAAWGFQVGLKPALGGGRGLGASPSPPSHQARALLPCSLPGAGVGGSLCRPQGQSGDSTPPSLAPQHTLAEENVHTSLGYGVGSQQSTWIVPRLADGDSRRMGSFGDGVEGLGACKM